MGVSKRPKPKRLGEKLLKIRESLNLSQNQMLDRLGLKNSHFRSNISAFERGIREPSLLMLLLYARVAGVSTDALIDDELDLPIKLPAKPKH
jgi:transcriptional regulator with XRE-family HTH domain